MLRDRVRGRDCSTSASAPAICSWPSSSAHILLISAQVNSKPGVPVLEAVTFGVFARGAARRVRRRVAACGTSGAATSALRGVRAENETLKRAARRARRSRCRSSARSPIARARSSSCSTCAIASTLDDRGRRDHRRRRDARLPHGDHRQGHARRPAGRHGGDRAGRRRRPRGRAERRARRRCSCSSIATPPPARSSSGRARRASSSAAATIGCAWSTCRRCRTSWSATSS